MEKAYLSVVIPLFNEEENIGPLYAGLVRVLERTGRSFEIILVDDGSRDGTFTVISSLFEADQRVHAIRLGKNYGQAMALAAGVDHAEGEIVIFMDGDLQHDPEDIPRFLEKIDEGYDVVSGWRKHRVDNLLTRRVPSRIANWMIGLISGVRLNDFGTTFKAYRREIIKSIKLYRDMHRYIPALVSWTGASIIEIPINNKVRNKGKSNYNLLRAVSVSMDLLAVLFLIEYRSRPLHFFGRIGLFFTGIGFLGITWLTVGWVWFNLNMLENRGALLLAALSVLMGIQFITTGLLSEIIARTYYEAQHKTPYFVRKMKTRRSQSHE